jgi:hypothetical protein
MNVIDGFDREWQFSAPWCYWKRAMRRMEEAARGRR